MPHWLNRFSWWCARKVDNWLLREALDRGCAGFGLPAITDALDHFADPGRSLLATDTELAPSPPDVQLPQAPTGAMLLDEPGNLPEAVKAFLAAGPPPVYIGFGSMPDARPGRTREQLLEVVRRVGCRAILYASDSTLEAQKAGPGILIVGSLPHALLFPRVALAIHHGGAGTSARVARAGIPQVILPHVLDQFPWAARIAERDLGARPIRKPRPSTGCLVARIREALASTVMQDRAAKLGRALAGRDGAARAASIVVGEG